MTAAAPSGVVTFLFTDVEGSTRRWEADADAMRAALAAHDGCCVRRLRRTEASCSSNENLVDPNTTVDVSTGMIAAGRLQALIDSRAGRTSMAEILYKMDRIINAVHDTVPAELWPEILRKIEGPVAEDTPMDAFDEFEGAQDSYDATEAAEAGEDYGTAIAQSDSPVNGCRAPVRTIDGVSSAIRDFSPLAVKDSDDIY